MQRSFIQYTLLAAAMLLSASLAFAAETKPGTTGEPKATSAPKATEKSAKAAKAPAAAKPVDINSARKAELKTLPGISDADADKIIAGRPYLTKAHLVTRDIITTGRYESIKQLIIAKQKPEEKAKPAKAK